MTMRRGAPALLLVALLLATPSAAGLPAAAAGVYPPLTAAQINEVRAAIDEMIRNPRGPYLRLRWFCEDGSVLPPEPYACLPHGGGIQHAEMRPEVQALGDLGFNFGSIFSALTAADLVDADRAGYRARELVVQAYLERAEDGWVMRRARFYRGARQAEDEEAAGARLLEQMLGDADWRRGRSLLASRLLDTVPHGGSGSLTETIRTLAVEVAELDPDFADLRVKLHSVPGPSDIEAVGIHRRQLEPGAPPALAERLDRLIEALRVQYGSGLDPDRWRALAAAGGAEQPSAAVEALLQQGAATPVERLALLTAVAQGSRMAFDRGESLDGRQAVALLELATDAADRATVEVAAWLEQIDSEPPTRRQLLEVARELVRCAYADGWLSAREIAAQETAFKHLLSTPTMTAGDYHSAVGYLQRSSAWADAAVRQAFAMVIDRYLEVEPAVQHFSDDLLRGSVLLPMSSVLAMLSADAALAIGQEHEILGTTVRSGVLSLNPGVAAGPLYIADSASEARVPDPRGIYVLPETPPELGKISGILTLGQGSRLSHVQLLARGLGIPNASISPSFLEPLRAHVGAELVYSVSPRGSVHLGTIDAATAAELERLRGTESGDVTLRIDESRLDLSIREVLPLEAVGAADAGRVAGPKAANLGQLHRLFPDRVAPGLVLPFGVFRAHVERPPADGGPSIIEQIEELFRTRTDVAARLASIQTQILSMPLLPAFERQLDDMMRERFGEPGTYGVFVRSDTNVEDLPNFSGAGLNLTVMNVIGREALLQAIRQVWASPFTERAYGWRARAVQNPTAIYPSIVLLGSRASEASGVLVTRDVDGVLRDARGPNAHWTVTLSPGVGGGVEGEATETMLVAADGEGEPLLLSSARTPWRKALASQAPGGVREVAVEGDLELLTPTRLRDLVPVIDRIRELYPPAFDDSGEQMPWDIEFGFINGHTLLYQIRPFLAGGATAVLTAARELDAHMESRAGLPLDLGQPVNR